MEIFVSGDRVGTYDGKLKYSEYGDEPYYGTVTDILSNGRVMVKWDSKYMDSSKSVDPNRLMFESDLQAKYSELERAFRKVESEVAVKMKEASQMILDAQKIAKAAGFDLQELHDATSHLENAMDSAGWQTSSWHC